MLARRLPALIAAAALLAGLTAGSAAPAQAGTAAVHGRITLEGEPSGTRVTLWTATGAFVGGTAPDDSGAYSLHLPPAGTRYYVVANVEQPFGRPATVLERVLPSYVGADSVSSVAWQRTAPAVATGADRNLDIALRASTPVTGVNPVLAGRRVMLQTLGGTLAAESVADADGAFTFQVAPGRYRMAVRTNPVYAAYRGAPFTVVDGVPAIVQVEPVVGGEIAGTLTHRGRPVRNVTVLVAGGGLQKLGRTDADGRYRVGGLPAGDYTVRMGSSHGWGSRWMYQRHTVRDVEPGRTTVLNARLVLGGRVSARFSTAATTGSFTWLLRSGVGTGGRVVASGYERVSSTSRNVVSPFGLPGGSYTLQVHTVGSPRYAQRSFTVQPGRTAALGTLRPTLRTVTLRGTAAPATNVQVRAGGWRDRYRSTPSTGRFVYPHLMRGTYTVTVEDATHTTRRYPVRLPESRSMALHRGDAFGAVSGTALVNGAPLPFALLDPRSSDGRWFGGGIWIVRGDIRGTHQVPGAVSVGSVLDVWDRPFPPATPYYLAWPAEKARFTVEPGETTDLGTVEIQVRGE